MVNIKTFSDEKWMLLQKKVISDLTLTRDNINGKLLDLPKIHAKYRKLYYDQKKILNNVENALRVERKKKYHFYKFDNNFVLDNATERMLYVDGDDEICEISYLRDKQQDIVEFLKDTLNQISKMSFIIRSYVDLEKLRNGVFDQ
jgi:hypothetical protein